MHKDVRAELRSLDNIGILVAFSLILLLTFGFALNPVEKDLNHMFSGIYWLGVTLSGLIGIGKAFDRERESGMLEALAVLPADRGAIYVAKAATTSLWLTLVALLMSPMFFILLDIDLRPQPAGWMAVTLAGIMGLVAVGTLLSGMATYIRGAELLLPLLLLPFTAPVVIAAVRITEGLLRGEGFLEQAPWFQLLIGYDIVFFVISLILFDYVVEV